MIWLHVPPAIITKDHIEDVNNLESYKQQRSTDDNLDENVQNLTSHKPNKMRTEGEGRDYTLSEMTDLQSRLMLVTGKADAGRESIERFTSVCKYFVVQEIYFPLVLAKCLK